MTQAPRKIEPDAANALGIALAALSLTEITLKLLVELGVKSERIVELIDHVLLTLEEMQGTPGARIAPVTSAQRNQLERVLTSYRPVRPAAPQ